MKFGGWHKSSLIDFPGKISVVLFTQGCTFRCPFCHNPDLVLPHRFTSCPISEEEVLALLEKRKKKLDGIVITGGEPTMHSDLKEFIKKVKSLGYALKLDTNGTIPEAIEDLLQEDLLDYVAMDIKASFPNYNKLTGAPVNIDSIEKSIRLIMERAKDYEFRTTIIKELHDAQEVAAIVKSIAGAKRYVLQKFRPDVTLDSSFQSYSACTDEEMSELQRVAASSVQIVKNFSNK
jgi:pyruvate formate lyase activating enzyme